MIIPARAGKWLGKWETLQGTGAARAAHGKEQQNGGWANVSGAHRSEYGDTGGHKCDSGRVVRTRSILGERAIGRRQSGRGAQVVQPCGTERSGGCSFAAS